MCLRIKDLLGHLLEGEQIDGLLMELVHAPAALLGYRFKNSSDSPLHRPGITGTEQQQSQSDRRRMGGDDCVLIQLQRRMLAKLAFDPW